MNKPHQRVLLKLPGEVFDDEKLGVDPVVISGIAREVTMVVSGDIQVTVAMGDGNYFRGTELDNNGMARDRTDHMGILGTVISAIVLQDPLEEEGIHTHVQSATNIVQTAEPYTPHRVERCPGKGRLIILGTGSGIPYFSTGAVAAQCTLGTSARVPLTDKQGTDGVYDPDPRTNPEAGHCEHLTHNEFLSRDLKVADATVIALARDSAPSIIFSSLSERGNIDRAVQGKPIGTSVSR